MPYFVSSITPNRYRTPEGYLVCVGVPIARTGTQVYGADELKRDDGKSVIEPGDDGVITIDRDEREVFSPETIASFEGKDITIKHPDEFVDPDNWREISAGHIARPRRGKGQNKNDLIADLIIKDRLAISLVEGGLREVSCGYEAEYVQTGPGKGEQRKIIGNHLALVERGRAGSAYRIKDHMGVKMGKTLTERWKRLFAKAADQAAEELEQEIESEKDQDENENPEAAIASMKKTIDEMNAKIEKMGRAVGKQKPLPSKNTQKYKDAVEEKPDKKESKDQGDIGAEIAELKSMISEFITWMKEQAGGEEESYDSESEDGESEESEDEASEEDPKDKEKSESNDESGNGMKVISGDADTLARAEILAPGIRPSKNIKTDAIKACYQTVDGKKIIDAISGEKNLPKLESAKVVDTMFMAASELLKRDRTSGIARARRKAGDDFSSFIFNDDGIMTPEKLNKQNADYWKDRH